MITLKDFIEAVNYKITGGSEYGWNCFGPNARYLDSDDTDSGNCSYSTNAIFDSKTQVVYSIEAWDYKNNREYRWINPSYKVEFEKEAAEKDINPAESLDGQEFINLDVDEDILEKVSKIASGEEYDTRVKVPVDFSDADLLKYMKLAHEMDITFNELVERAIKAAIDEYNSNPKEFEERVGKFKNENYSCI